MRAVLHAIIYASILLSLMCRSAVANDAPVALRLSHWLPTSHPFHATLQGWLASVTEASGGAITGTIHPAEAIGRAPDHLKLVRSGDIDVGFINPAFDRADFPLLLAGEIPMLIGDPVGGSRAFDRWYREYGRTEIKGVVHCATFVFGPGTLHSVQPFAALSDLSGLSVRSANTSVGAMLVALGAGDVRGRVDGAKDLIQSGAVNSITLPWDSLSVFKIDDLVKNHIDVALYVTPFTLVINQGAYDRMSDNQRRIIDAHCTSDWAARLAEPFAISQRRGETRLKSAAGHITTKLDTADMARWKSAAETVERAWVDGSAGATSASAVALEKLKTFIAEEAARRR
jgi:TRAP-type transport system periplasmic protein